MMVGIFGAATGRGAEFDGSMTLYDFEGVEGTAIPDSLTPIHISYIARHGARYLTSENKIKSVESVLEEARKAGTLTKAGRECMKLMEEVREKTDGRWGLLSENGKEEEARLGREMAEMYPEIFKSKGVRIEGKSSYVPRVVQTMNHFFLPIAEGYPGIDISQYSGKKYDNLTRFFDIDKSYIAWRKGGDWKEAYERDGYSKISVAPAERLVGKGSGMSESKLRRLTYDLYKVMQGFRAMGMEVATEKWMTESEYRACWEATNMEKYFQYSLSSLSSLPAQSAADVMFYLLGVQTTLSESDATGVDALFGHAETLLPVFALLGVPGATALPLDYTKLASEWSDAELTPLGANLEIIYSKSRSGAIYASMRLNGRNVSPINDPDRLTVSMVDLASYWLERYLNLMAGRL